MRCVKSGLMSVALLSLIGCQTHAPVVQRTRPAAAPNVVSSTGTNLSGKVADLSQSLSNLNLDGDDEKQISRELRETSNDLAHGDRELALADLQAAWSDYGSDAFILSHAGAAKDEALFAKVWKERAQDSPDSLKQVNRSQPLLAQALGEFARDQANGYYHSSEAWGRETTFEGGLAYAGQAEGLYSFANFCDSVTLPSGQIPTLRSLAGEVDDLESRILAAFGKAPAAEDEDFIDMSSSIKTARELDARKWYAGEALAYLVSDLTLTKHEGTPLSRSEVLTRLRQEEASWSPAADNSIPRYFVELAKRDLDQGEDGIIQASAIATDTLKRYRQILEPAAPRPEHPLLAKRVKITLVRWPYT